MKRVVVIGGTGLVGGLLLRLLVEECESVTAIGRRPSGVAKVNDVVADLAKSETYREHLAVDCVFSALGTTIKKAGSEAAFRAIDYDAVLVSSVGADAKSGIFDSRVKGELEDALRELPFPRGVRVVRPSVLLGERGESRPGERFAAGLMSVTAPLFAGGLKKYRAIDAEAVARALITVAKSEGAGFEIYEGDRLFRAAQ